MSGDMALPSRESVVARYRREQLDRREKLGPVHNEPPNSLDGYYLPRNGPNVFVIGRVFEVGWHESTGNEGRISRTIDATGKNGTNRYHTYKFIRHSRPWPSKSNWEAHISRSIGMLRKLRIDSVENVDMLLFDNVKYEKMQQLRGEADHDQSIGSGLSSHEKAWPFDPDIDALYQLFRIDTPAFAKDHRIAGNEIPESFVGSVAQQTLMKACCEKLLSFFESDMSYSAHIYNLISCVLNTARPLYRHEVQAMLEIWNKDCVSEETQEAVFGHLDELLLSQDSIFDLSPYDQVIFREPQMYSFLRNFGIDGIDSSHTTISDLCCEVLQDEHRRALEDSRSSAFEQYALTFGLFHSITAAAAASGADCGLADLVSLSNRNRPYGANGTMAFLSSYDSSDGIDYLCQNDGHGIGYAAQVPGSDGIRSGLFITQKNVSRHLNAQENIKSCASPFMYSETQYGNRAKL